MFCNGLVEAVSFGSFDSFLRFRYVREGGEG